MRGRIVNIYGGGHCHTPHTHTLEGRNGREEARTNTKRREAKPTEGSRSERSEGRLGRRMKGSKGTQPYSLRAEGYND